jgi:outer membrane protein assembly factor BamB
MIRFGRRAAAVLLAVFVPLAVTPLAIIDQTWIGAAMFGAGLGTDVTFVGLGLVVFVGGAIPVAMLALVPGVHRGARRGATLAAALVALTATLAVGPLHELSPSSWLPGGRVLLVAWAVPTLVALVGVARGPARAARGSGRELALAGTLLAAVFVTGTLVTAAGDEIPMAPSGLLAADFRGGERLTGEPLAVPPSAPNPALARGQGSNIHNDAAMTDTYTGRSAIDPHSAELRSFRAPGDCASILFDERGRMVAVCVGGTRIMAYVLDPATLEPLAERRLADRDLGADFLTNFAGGGYAVLDREGRLVLGTADGTVELFTIGNGRGGLEIMPLEEYDVSATLADSEPITSVLPDAGGDLFYVGAEGTVGVLDPATGEAAATRFEGTDIENSFALAPGGGAFVVTSEQLLRLRIDRRGRPALVWSESYDRGERLKPGQTSRASGTTPTVMLGGRYVAITDNAEPRMNVLVYKARARARGQRLVCEVPVFGPGESATENSLIAAGRSLFVENNYGYRLIDLIGGHSSAPGAARVDLDPGAESCEQVWENDEVRIPSVVSKVSAADGTMLTYTKPEMPSGIDAFYFTALDAATGEVLWERRGGTGPLANNHYAALYVGPDGRLYVGSTGGVIGLT